ncbi:hypothetical protein PPL_04962 [Heterostelium album PN500]|uniref:Uncharacterized protein n=1 Tax=Heterostelium pallidum (strain ATCC 26659 / Pp 5 / PN500) TaxID=670386 RepID=D3B918_HETP5|nr:hypothetical protein PPL_04962 [Heterostelium album PN500]EFA82057.1 hypothetical protein PPL_04962 [Heterostelium album PN500]|eukprot:XP_020434174.1 hypothetical protein PPL_04962 [Heterostelium album PN500]
MSYPDFVESNNENEKYFQYLTAEGFLTGTKFNSHTRSLKKNRSNGYQRDALVPSESVYHFEIYQLIAHQSNLPNIIYPEITSSSDYNADRRADMFIKYRNWSVVLELVAHQNPKGVEAHLDSALEYKNRTNADETWVLNFTCGPIDTQIKSKSGVGLIHVCHSRDYSAVNVQVHYPNQDIQKTYHDTRQYPVINVNLSGTLN